MIDPDRVLNSAKLPTLPKVAVDLLDLTKDPESGINDYTRVIRTDPAISAKIIKAANSSYFGLSKRVSTLESAVPLLGATVVTSLTLSFCLVNETDPATEVGEYLDRLWSRSILQAVTAETIAKRFRVANPPECFLAGLLCDIGVLAQICTIPLEYKAILDEAAQSGRSLLDVERERNGFDHVEIGAKLMENWRMPESLLLATRLHHADIPVVRELSNAKGDCVARTVRFAACVGELLVGQGTPDVKARLDELTQLVLGPNVDDLTQLLDELRDLTDDAGQMMAIKTDNLPRPSEILARANSQLAEIALREHVAMSEASVKTVALELENRKLKASNTQLHEEAGTDPLTTLYNRRAFDRVVQDTANECIQNGQTISVIFSDVDRFKNLNDTYGHQFGDIVLKRVAQIVKSQIRESDFAARFGGEEFVIIAANCPIGVVERIAERIRQQVENEPFIHQGNAVDVTISIGACVCRTVDMPSIAGQNLVEFMLREADAAMYECKRNGRNQTLVKNVECTYA